MICSTTLRSNLHHIQVCRGDLYTDVRHQARQSHPIGHQVRQHQCIISIKETKLGNLLLVHPEFTPTRQRVEGMSREG